MKIALLSPAGAMHRYNGLFSKNLHYAPMTLTLLAALVPPELEAEVVIYDETAGPIPLDLKADIVGITCITGTAPRAYRYADYFRTRGCIVVLGGPHPSLVPEEAKQHADSVITGLAEGNFQQFLYDCRDRTPSAYYHQQEGCSIAGRPALRRDLLDRKRYITLNTVEAVRGCHLNCTFCAYPKAFGRKVITRPVADVIDEIKSLKGKDVVFPDVNLLSDRDYAVELFTAMKPLKRWWFGLTTSDVVLDDEMVELFDQSGCKGLLIGFESVNQSSQKEMHKGFNRVGDYQKLMDRLHRHGIMVMGCFAFGADEDDLDVFMRTVRLADEIKIDLPRYALLTPFPQTDLYTQLASEGRIVEHDHALFDVEHCVFTPKNMTAEQLEQGLADAWHASYSLRSIFKRMQWFNPRILWPLYLLTNFGYRKYAKKLEQFKNLVMTDNSDIPAAPDSHLSSDTPGVPACPSSSDIPAVPACPSSSDIPAVLACPSSSDIPCVPDSPLCPDTPAVPACPACPPKD